MESKNELPVHGAAGRSDMDSRPGISMLRKPEASELVTQNDRCNPWPINNDF